MRSSLSRLALLAAIAVGALSTASCTHDSGDDGPASPSPSAPQSTSTADSTTLSKSNARLTVSIEQMKGGVPKSHRAGIRHAIAKPIERWMDAAYLTGTYPRERYTADDFPGWTGQAATLARHDQRVTTNAAVSRHIVGVVADRRSAGLYVFAVGGHTGGATARINLKMTAEKPDHTRTTFVVSGELYLTPDDGHWRIFGYDLHRTVLRR